MCVGSFEPQAYIPTKQTLYCGISISACLFLIFYVTNIIQIIILGYNFVEDSAKYVFLVAIEVFYDLFISICINTMHNTMQLSLSSPEEK